MCVQIDIQSTKALKMFLMAPLDLYNYSQFTKAKANIKFLLFLFFKLDIL